MYWVFALLLFYKCNAGNNNWSVKLHVPTMCSGLPVRGSWSRANMVFLCTECLALRDFWLLEGSQHHEYLEHCLLTGRNFFVRYWSKVRNHYLCMKNRMMDAERLDAWQRIFLCNCNAHFWYRYSNKGNVKIVLHLSFSRHAFLSDYLTDLKLYRTKKISSKIAPNGVWNHNLWIISIMLCQLN